MLVLKVIVGKVVVPNLREEINKIRMVLYMWLYVNAFVLHYIIIVTTSFRFC